MANPVSPRQLEAFRAVILTGSMTGAGEMLNITQPAVSRLIRDLEQDLELHLFQRNGARISPTDQARTLYQDVERLFVGGERIREAAAAIRGLSEGSLRIAAMPSLTLGYLPGLVDAFTAERHGVSVILHSDSSVNVVELVARQQFDIGLAFVSSEQPSTRIEALPETEAVCVLPVDHPLAARETLRPRDLAEEDFIILGHTSLLRHHILAAFDADRVAPRLRFETRYSATACAFVAQGLGVAVVDPFVPPVVGGGKIVARRFRPRIGYRFSLIYPARRPRSGLAAEFGDLLRTRMQRDFF